ncbi:MAG: hypothetical protein FGF48_02555 [Candidatus Brockarchaeota archaeon]|nr:hypothetical protein [Candidatus Brockarchaeota archaeon]
MGAGVGEELKEDDCGYQKWIPLYKKILIQQTDVEKPIAEVNNCYNPNLSSRPFGGVKALPF